MQTISVAEGCTRCPALVANRHRIVHGYGSQEASVVFIGEAPGYKGGDLTGVPFTRDRSGVRLQQLLIDLGLSAETDPRVERPKLRCFVTNVVRCNPPSNRMPARAEIANCQPYLWQELALLQARILVPMGNVATQVLFLRLKSEPAPSISLAHARIFVESGVWIVPMRHPARISNADVQRFVAALRPLLRTTACS
jgi:uracil-DNA glycosylase family 4